MGPGRTIVAVTGVVLLIGGSAGCAPGATQVSSAPAETQQPSTSATAAETPASSLVLGAEGVGELKLGMTRAEAKATGLTEGISDEPGGACGGDGDGWLAGARNEDQDSGEGTLVFSSTSGTLVSIFTWGDLATPAGIRLGSTLAEVQSAYPEWEPLEPDGGLGWVKTVGDYQYSIQVGDDQVSEMALESSLQDCYG